MLEQPRSPVPVDRDNYTSCPPLPPLYPFLPAGLREAIIDLYERYPLMRQSIWRFRRLTHPAWLGTLRRTTPLSDRWGHDRGTPVDRYYIESFLDEHRDDIHGAVLEVKDSGYTDRFGSHITCREVLDIDPTNPRATIVADLAMATTIASEQFDCFVLTQTLQYIYDLPAAITHAHRILRPGGVLLATLPAITRTEPELMHTDYWRFSVPSCRSLFGALFGADRVTARSHGNVLACITYLTGMAYEELSRRELDVHDAQIPLVITVRAVK